MLYNIIQIVAFQALFLLVYDLLFRKETFFNYNRAYLLITSVLSFCLPFLKFPKLQSITTKDVVIQLPEVFIGIPSPSPLNVPVSEQAGILIEQPNVPTWQYIVSIGMLIAFLMFIFKLAKLYWMRYKNPKRWKGNVLIVQIIKSSVAFSFFNTIFLGERIPEDKKPTIYKHELVHIEEFHSLDLLYFELLRIVMWFNPLVYLYQSRIKELHEYIADAKTVKQNGKSSYYQTLLNQVFDVNNVSFTNTFFNKSLIKKRIAMLQKSRSKQINLIKYGLLIPMVLGMLIYTSTEVKAQEITESTELAQELTEEELIKKYYDEMVAMTKNGSTFLEIADYAGMSKSRSKYIISKEEFLKSKAYMQYLAEKMIERKSENGTLTDRDFDLATKMKLRSTYAEHREWLKTNEAKEHWESYAKDGELRLVVDDLVNKTNEEQKRFDKLLDQLSNDANFSRLIVCEAKGGSRIELYDDEADEQEMQIPLVYEDVEVPFSVIEEVPTTKDCKELLTNEERKQCMSQFVAKHVNTNFNTGLADSLGIKGRQRIFVSFKIDKKGLIKGVKARASHPALETEAVRVINMLPKFIPGKQKGKTVVVPYSLPIVFQIAGNEEPTTSQKHEDYIGALGDDAIENLKKLEEQRDRILKNSTEANLVVIQLNKQIDSLRKERRKLLNLYLKERSKLKESTTVLINRKDELLINDKRGDFAFLDKILQLLPKDKKHLVRIVYDKEASKSAIQNVVERVEKYPFAIIQQEVGGPVPSNANSKTKLPQVPISVVDVSPAHPNCKTITDNEERKQCTSAEVAKFVNQNFNMTLASKLNLPEGSQRIFTSFSIGKDGFVKNIKVRAVHPKLEEETKRVLELLPQFIPGEHEGENVDVPYSLPIYFQINNTKKKKN